MTYRSIVEKIENLGIMPDHPPSLESTQTGLKLLGFESFPFFSRFKEDPSRVIVVAGTNGKGSVCATLEALFCSAGEQVGLYTSPHLIETTERIRINAQDVSEELFCKAYQQVSKYTSSCQLTHFETLTLMALWIFCSGISTPPVDRIILEVGMGGTWDATNTVPHGVSVITPIAMDHSQFLGSTLTSIAANKFGIVQKNSLVIHTQLHLEVIPLAKVVQQQTESKWIEAAHFPFFVEKSSNTPAFFLNTPWGKTRLALAGPRAAENTSLALTVFEQLGFTPQRKHLEALTHIHWPGRMEQVPFSFGKKIAVYLSGDHNPHGIQSLLKLLPYYPRKHLHLLIGVGHDKDLDGILSPLFSLPQTSCYLTESPFRGRKLYHYGSWLSLAQGAWSDPWEAFQTVLKKTQDEDLMIVTGSLYLVGKIRGFLLNCFQ